MVGGLVTGKTPDGGVKGAEHEVCLGMRTFGTSLSWSYSLDSLPCRASHCAPSAPSAKGRGSVSIPRIADAGGYVRDKPIKILSLQPPSIAQSLQGRKPVPAAQPVDRRQTQATTGICPNC